MMDMIDLLLDVNDVSDAMIKLQSVEQLISSNNFAKEPEIMLRIKSLKRRVFLTKNDLNRQLSLC